MVISAQEAIHIDSGHTSPMRLFLGTIGAREKDFEDIINTVHRDLEWSGQFDVTVDNFDCPTTKKEVLRLFDAGFPLVLFVSQEKDMLVWRLYDATQALMVKGKRYKQESLSSNKLAHRIAHDIWFELTGHKSPFLTKLAYIKKVKNNTKKQTHICIADYNGEHEEVLLASNAINIAPYWNNKIEDPLILYSEFTPRNVRLMAIDLRGNKRVVLDLDGTSVGVSYDPHSSDVVYCRSGELWHFHYDPLTKKSIHRLIVKEKEACASPTVRANGDIIYCSQGKIKYYHADTQKSDLITHDGYCVAPTFSEASGKIVYSKRINRIMQLFVYDLKHKNHEQITFDTGDKIDASWSPCGNYVTFCFDTGKFGRIATINVMTQTRHYITPSNLDCSYPAWSPIF